MTFELSILNILILFGAFQGFLLSIILLTTKRLKKTSNQFLALLLFSLALLNLVSTMEMPPNGVKNNFINYNPFFLVSLIPPSTYFFVLYLTEPNYKWKNKDFLFFLPLMIEVGFRMFRFSFYLRADYLTSEEHYTYNMLGNTLELVAVIFTVFVLIWSIKSLKQYENKLYENYSEVKSHSLAWLRNVLIAGAALTALWLVVTLSDYSSSTFSLEMAMTTLLCLTALIYWVGYSMIIRQELLDTPIFAISNGKTSIESNELSSKTDEYYTQLKKMMEEDKIYQDPNLNMTILSEKTGLSNSYLSQIINQKDGRNFFDFVNEYRIDEVKQKMSDPKYSHYTILALAQDSGFGSKSTFNSFFKKTTGKTPSQYKRELG